MHLWESQERSNHWDIEWRLIAALSHLLCALGATPIISPMCWFSPSPIRIRTCSQERSLESYWHYTEVEMADAQSHIRHLCVFIKCRKWKSLSLVQLFVTPWTDYRVHGILQARIVEWVAFPFSRESSEPRDQTQVSHIASRFFTIWATREAQEHCNR